MDCLLLLPMFEIINSWILDKLFYITEGQKKLYMTYMVRYFVNQKVKKPDETCFGKLNLICN